MNETIQNAFNKQINAEIYSSYLYLSMAAYFDSLNLSGMSGWMKAQAAEELTHADKFYRYINDRSGRVKLDKIEGPPSEWDSPLVAFEAALSHERKVSALINDLLKLAKEEKDYASDNFLQWFVAEQVEEEATVDEVINQLKLAGSEGPGLFMLDRELGQRAFTLPVAGEGE